MPQANLTYDAPYNRGLVKLIGELDHKHWEKAYPAYHPNPMGYRMGAFHGEMVGGGSSPEKYLRSGNSPAYPPLHLSAGLAVNSGGAMSGGRYAGVDGAIGLAHPAMSGGKLGLNPFDLGFRLGHEILGPALLGKARSGGRRKGLDIGKALGSVAKIAEPIATKVAVKAIEKSLKGGRRKGLDIGKALGSVAKIAEPIATKVAVKAVEKSLKGGKRGYNFLDAVKRVGHAVGEPYDKVASKIVEDTAMKAVGLGRRGKSARAEIVKKVMRERGVKMIEASKIVKAEGLY